MAVKDTTGIIPLDAHTVFGRRDRGDKRSRPPIGGTRVHRLLARAEELAARNAMLLRESDHRIKNSLQIVSSLLMLQARRSDSVVSCDALTAAAARIAAVSRMHDALQHGGEAATVKLGAVLAEMCQALHAMAGDSRIISIVVTDETIEAPVALAQPLVLAVNELVINALRHAFTEDIDGAVHVNLQQAHGEVCVVVADNGRGLPADHGAGSGYGMKLVRAMVHQIGGALRVENKAGARFTITAPLHHGAAKKLTDATLISV